MTQPAFLSRINYRQIDASSILFAWMTAFLMFAEGLIVIFGTGPSSRLVPLSPLLTLVAVAAAWMKQGDRDASVLARTFRAPLAYLAVGAGLVLAGVVTGEPVHLLAAIVQPVTIALWIVAGFMLGRNWPTFERGMFRVLRLAVTVQLFAGVAQLVGRRIGVYGPVWLWGRFLETAYGTSILTRASGLFLNPNTYSAFGLLALIWALYTRGSKNDRYYVGITSSLVIVLGGSRTALGITVLVVAIWLLASTSRAAEILSSRRRVILLVCLAGATLLLLSLTPYGAIFQDRAVAGFQVLRFGPSADVNVDARLSGWMATFAYLHARPMGTLTPPFGKLGVVDGDYVRCLAQGSLLYLAAYVLVLGWALRRSMSDSRLRVLFWTTVAVAIMGFFQSVSETVPAMPLFWALLGAAGAQSLRGAEAPASTARHDGPEAHPIPSHASMDESRRST